ncbi:MAG: NUDIX domain-containing protein, partial [Paracoccaceae bacterium]|nr:NUDIX domain-containing protein [Paracoccaceae bacterium]
FAYELRSFEVKTPNGQENCQVYWPPADGVPPGEPWLLSDWQRDWGDLSLEAADEAMSYFGQIDADTLVSRFPMIRARAATRMRARSASAPTNIRSGMKAEDVTKEVVNRSHAGFYALDVMQLRHKKFNGEQSELLRREVFLGTDAAIVLPYDPVSDQVLLVEQFRMGPTGRHDPVPWCLEPVAGLIDAGEGPETTAIREAKEEADLDISSLEFVSKGYSSPGASSEFFFLYVGLCTLPDDHASTGGLVDEGEDIRSHVLSFEDAMHHVDSGEINVIPTVLCLNWLARHRDRLRAAS